MAGNPNRLPYWVPDNSVARLTTEQKKKLATEIRTKITRFQLTYTWLINRLADEGLLTDKYEMSSTLSGTRTGSKAEEILRLSITILTDYENRMTSAVDP